MYVYPSCRQSDVTEDWFGTQLADPFAWLADRKDPEVLSYVKRQNEFTDAYFSRLPVKEKIAELKAEKLPELPSRLIPYGDGWITTIYRDGDYQVTFLDEKLQSAGIFAPPEQLSDRLVFSADPCPKDNSIFALMTQLPGASRPNLTVIDREKNQVLLDIAMVFSFAWSRENGCLYYSSSESDPEKQTAHSVFFSFDPKTLETKFVYEDDSPAIFGQVHASVDGKYILAMVCQDYSHARWVALNTRDGSAVCLTPDVVEWTYVDSLRGVHYFITLSEAAHGAVIAVGQDGKWKTVLPEGDKLFLEEGFSLGDKLFVIGRENVSARLIQVESGKTFPLPSLFGTLSLLGRNQEQVYLSFESFVDAPQIASFDGEHWTTVLSSGQERKQDIVVEQHFAPSCRDGKSIPYYLVHRKDAQRNGNQPVLAYAYGGYNISMPPAYTETVTQTVISRWVEKGGVYVHINNRGGNEYGPAWHLDGMGMNKRHCYEDFIGVIEQVIQDGWTRKGKVGICGCSNGGLLMSALVTMRPDLWGAVIDSVPHTDMIHFAQDDRGPMYITEYGNPRESKEMFEYLLSYSPYHNVKKTAYPPTYIQTGELDNNVPPYHGKKLAARMQAETTGSAPILLRVLAEGSHDRGKGEVFWQTIAEMQCFLEEHLMKDRD